jgi:hypothetical protein
MVKVEEDTNANTEDAKSIPLESHRFSAAQMIALLALVLVLIFSPKGGDANAYLETRSVTISSSIPSEVVRNDFQYDSLGSPSVGSIVFEYCANTPLIALPCVAPVGFNSESANLQFQSGDVGYSIHPDTSLSPNRVILSRVAAASSAGTKQYRIGNITNPSATNATTYVRITTHSSTNGTGVYDDTGSVAFATLTPLTISVYVPPYLSMCSGVSVAPDCSSVTGEIVDMGELSKVSANSATTQFAVATNSYDGYSAIIVGSTMTAGNSVIPALASPTFSQPGVSQFGINLRQNSSPSVGANVDGNGTGSPSANYSNPNTFRFQSGDTIASSSLSTEWNRYTISYLVNVADGQPAGRYASTLTVIATTTF